jgi:hypothetical protein
MMTGKLYSILHSLKANGFVLLIQRGSGFATPMVALPIAPPEADVNVVSTEKVRRPAEKSQALSIS